MFLLVPALVAGIIALLCGGSLRNLAAVQVRGGLILLSLGVQLAIYLPLLRRSGLVVHHAELIYLVAMALAIAGMLRNWRLGVPMRVATLGLILNATVIAANGGHMPVNAAALHATIGSAAVQTATDPQVYVNTRLATGSSHLLFLSDVIPVRVPLYHGNVFSAGDVLIASGVAMLVFGGVRRRSGTRDSGVPRGTAIVPSGLA
jgi:hypothetical protein